MKLILECDCGNKKEITINHLMMRKYVDKEETIYIEDFNPDFHVYQPNPDGSYMTCSKCNKKIVISN